MESLLCAYYYLMLVANDRVHKGQAKRPSSCTECAVDQGLLHVSVRAGRCMVGPACAEAQENNEPIPTDLHGAGREKS